MQILYKSGGRSRGFPRETFLQIYAATAKFLQEREIDCLKNISLFCLFLMCSCILHLAKTCLKMMMFIAANW